MEKISLNKGTQSNASLFYSTKSFLELGYRVLSDYGFLSQKEMDRLKNLKLEKRRKDWLLGRYAIKSLIQEYLSLSHHQKISLNSIEIDNYEDGAPFYRLIGMRDFQEKLSYISISHSHETALCAISDFAIGIDLEFVETRSDAFIRDFFSEEELYFIGSVDISLKHILANLIWSAKESILKVFHLGLTVDTRYVTCIPDENNPAEEVIYEFEIKLDDKIHTKIENHLKQKSLKGYWQVKNGFVYTFAVGD